MKEKLFTESSKLTAGTGTRGWPAKYPFFQDLKF